MPGNRCSDCGALGRVIGTSAPHREQTTVGQQRPRLRRQIARLVTEALAPAPLSAVLLLLVAWHSAPTGGEAVLWGLVSILFASLIPISYVLGGVRRRRLSDHHVGIRQQRPLPLLVGIASLLTGLVLLSLLGAPRLLVALVAAMAVGLVVALAITLVWKMSIHTAVAAGAVVILVLVFGPAFLLLMSLVALAGWSRVELGDHTPLQVAVGAGVGALVAATVFPLLR